MAIYRQIHTRIWDDPKFEEYSPYAKLLFVYGFSNKHRNESGLYPMSIKKMAFETGLTIEQTEAALNEIINSGAWKYDYELKVLWVINAMKYQSINEKCLISIRRDIETLSSPLVEEFKTHCNTIGYPLDTHYIPKQKASETHGGKGKGNDKGKDKNNICSPEIENFIKECCAMYPNSKGQISNSKKKELYKLGDLFKECIREYLKYVDSERNRGFDLAYQNRSTFFNNGYKDYLEAVEAKAKPKPDRPRAGQIRYIEG